MDILIHAANVLYLFSYLMRDVLWLRVLTVVAGSCLIVYFYSLPVPLLIPVVWNVIFGVINVAQIGLLLLERRPVHLAPDEELLYRQVFRALAPREMKRLLEKAHWDSAGPGERIVERGVELDRLLVLFAGHAAVEVDGRRLAELRDGQFVGEMSFVSGEKASADVVAVAPTRFVWWLRADLASLLAADVELRAAFDLILGADLAAKLRAA
jgi:Popeye protein conserved region